MNLFNSDKFLQRFENLPQTPEGMSIEIAQYAKDKCAVRFESDGTWKSGLCLDFEIFYNGGDFWVGKVSKTYSHREKAYIVPVTKVESFLKQIELFKRLPIVNMGQLSKREIRILNKAVKDGLIKKGQGGRFPKLKTIYCELDFDIEEDRRLGYLQLKTSQLIDAATKNDSNV